MKKIIPAGFTIISIILLIVFNLTNVNQNSPFADNMNHINELDGNTESDSLELCDFKVRDCLVVSNGNEIFLSSNNKIIKTETENLFLLKADNIDSFKINSAKLEGKDMYMGVIPVFFTKVDGYYQANAMLGACMHDKMIWQMTINATINNQTQNLTYSFYSEQD